MVPRSRRGTQNPDHRAVAVPSRLAQRGSSADKHTITLASAPTIVDYGSLAVLVGVVEAYLLTDLPGTQLWRRLRRRDSLTIRLMPYVFAVVLLAVAPKDRYIFWWLPFLTAGVPAFAATVSLPILILRWRRHVIAVWPGPEQRWSAATIMALILSSAVAATAGTVALALVTQDVRFALACAITVAWLLRWAWVLLARRRFPTPTASAT
jgi:hypothetical protein